MKKQSLSINRGKCILKERPFVYALKSKFRTERCDFCFKEGKVLKCSKCQYVYYCNRICQKEAWGIHKTECICLQKILPRTVPDAARFLARLILKLNNGGDFEKGYYTNKNYRKFKDLMSHYHLLKEDKKRMEHIESLTSVLRQLLGDELLPNPAELLCIYGRMLLNSFNILDQEMNSIGTGLYLGVSITDHSCKPNAVATFEGTTIFIHTTEEFSELDWSKIFISYVDLLNTPANRQIELQQNYFFLCDCVKCLNPIETIEMNAAACLNVKCPEYLNVNADTQKCSKCDTKITQNCIDKYNEVMDLTKMQLDNMKDIAYIDMCTLLLKKHERVLHPLNVWHVKTLDTAFESAIIVGKWELALEYGNELVTGFRKYCGQFNPVLGIIYMKIGKILLYQNKNKEALHNLNKAKDIITVTHGQQHSLFQSQLIPLLIDASSGK